jgi:hypothetical protein
MLTTFRLFDLGHLLNYVLNVVARSYDRACSRNCMPEYKLIQKKKKKKEMHRQHYEVREGSKD